MSVRRTLLIWYSLILVLVIGTFGTLLYFDRQRTAFKRIDAEIQSHALALAGTLEYEPDEGYDLEHTAVYTRRFDDERPGGLYFLILDPEGDILAQSGNVPKRRNPGGGRRREIAVPGAEGAQIIVGRGTHDAREDLEEFRSAILAFGAATLLLSLLGGWFLVGRVLVPIRRMTTAAERISEENLSERIDVGRTETELGRLAVTLNEAFDRLEGAFERQTRFTADASHELRTPLSIVVSNAECGLRRDRTAEEYREALAKCLRAGRRMTGVVSGLLALARADAGEAELERKTIELGVLVEETVAFLRPLAEEHGVALGLDLEPVTLEGDAERLRIAIENLVSNAIRYNRKDGRVDVSLVVEEDHAVLTVADTGVGIPGEALERVFERFYRVDRARSREVGGNGLGLAITKWVVTAHGGEICLTSREDAGTTVTVRLPLPR